MSSVIEDIELQAVPADAGGSAWLEPDEPVPADAGGGAGRKLDEPVPQRRYPRLTAVRLFNWIVILSLGIPKAVSTAKGESTMSNTFDWNSGVLWGVLWVDMIDTYIKVIL
jgi:hypothetical protein